MAATTRRSGSNDAETVLRAQLDFAEVIVGGFAQGAKAYALMWGPLGRPAAEAMETAAKVQRLYLEELKATLD